MHVLKHKCIFVGQKHILLTIYYFDCKHFINGKYNIFLKDLK